MSKLSELPKKYPRVFNDKPFYFECNDGWYDLLDHLCYMIDDRQVKVGLDIHVSQIKEKFGGLRFYCYGGDDVVYYLVDFASKLSYTVCEQCGNRGKLRNEHGWMYTACDEHYNGEDEDD